MLVRLRRRRVRTESSTEHIRSSRLYRSTTAAAVLEKSQPDFCRESRRADQITPAPQSRLELVWSSGLFVVLALQERAVPTRVCRVHTKRTQVRRPERRKQGGPVKLLTPKAPGHERQRIAARPNGWSRLRAPTADWRRVFRPRGPRRSPPDHALGQRLQRLPSHHRNDESTGGVRREAVTGKRVRKDRDVGIRHRAASPIPRTRTPWRNSSQRTGSGSCVHHDQAVRQSPSVGNNVRNVKVRGRRGAAP